MEISLKDTTRWCSRRLMHVTPIRCHTSADSSDCNTEFSITVKRRNGSKWTVCTTVYCVGTSLFQSEAINSSIDHGAVRLEAWTTTAQHTRTAPRHPSNRNRENTETGEVRKEDLLLVPRNQSCEFWTKMPHAFPLSVLCTNQFRVPSYCRVPEDGKGMATSMLKCLIESDRCVCSPLFPCPIYPLWCPLWSNVWLWMINGGESPFLWEPVEMPLTHRRKAYHLCNSFSCFVPFRDGAQFCLCYLVGFVGAERCPIRSHNLCSRRPEVSYPSRHRTRGRIYLGVGSRWASCAHSLFIRPKLHFIWRGWYQQMGLADFDSKRWSISNFLTRNRVEANINLWDLSLRPTSFEYQPSQRG